LLNLLVNANLVSPQKLPGTPKILHSAHPGGIQNFWTTVV
jgi:hypothetical protein